jgi:hypothetical protein
MKRIPIIAGILLTLTFPLQAQLLKDLKRAATDAGKSLNTKDNRDKVFNLAMKDMERARAEFDSADFDYAILLSDNSGRKRKG